MTRKAYLKKLIQLGRTGDALEELSKLAEDTYYENTSILLLGQYNGLKQESHGLISEEQRNLRTNRLMASTNSLLKDLEQEVPGKFEEEVEIDPDKLKAPPATPASSSQGSKETFSTTNIFLGDVANVNSNNKGNITQGDITQNTDRSTHLHLSGGFNSMPLKELVEAEQQSGYITREEYEELMDILEEIEENPTPSNDKQKRKWKRWLGKALEGGRKFAGERLEKGMDTGIGEGVKDWLANGGLDQFKNLINSLVG